MSGLDVSIPQAGVLFISPVLKMYKITVTNDRLWQLAVPGLAELGNLCFFLNSNG